IATTTSSCCISDTSFSCAVMPESGTAVGMTAQLKLVSEMQQLLVVVAMFTAMAVARQTPWRDTYRRLALGAVVGFLMLTLSNIEIGSGMYRSGFVYDFTWILPFAFFPWAASAAPASEAEPAGEGAEELTRPRP